MLGRVHRDTEPTGGSGAGEGQMSRLQKFVEIGAYGEGPTRTAYVLDARKLPAPADRMQWHLVEDFNAGDEILKNSGLADVFKTAIRDGYAIVNLKG
jgi:hypothetical protein